MIVECLNLVGASPSGKAAVFGAAIQRFDPFRPSQNLQKELNSIELLFLCLATQPHTSLR